MQPPEATLERDAAPGPNAPEDDATRTATDQPRLSSEARGPQFAWRARLLWALVAIFQFGAAVVLIGLIVNGTLVGILPTVAPVVLVAFGATFLVARRSLGRGQRWAVAPSQVLAIALILGGIARLALSFAVPPVQIPLEPLLGVFVLLAHDAPTVEWRRPADWRTAGLTAIVIAMEVSVLSPAIPSGLPVLSGLSSGPETLDLSIDFPCPYVDAPWERLVLQVAWTWRGVDLGASAPDSLTVGVQRQGIADVWLDPLDGTPSMFTSMEMPDTRTVTVSIASGTRAGSYAIQAVQAADGPPLSAAPVSVTATYRHAGHWEVTRTQGCQP